MGDQRTQAAIGRIEAALDRIEAAARRRAASAGSGGSAETERLRTAHDRLREEVGSVIAELDQLIASGGR